MVGGLTIQLNSLTRMLRSAVMTEVPSPPSFVPPDPVERPELFFAFIGPTGTNLERVAQALRAELQIVGYEHKDIQLSDLLTGLKPHEDLANLKGKPENERITAFMDAGDAVRKALGHGGALAALAVAEIRRLREGDVARPATAYLLRSLKHPKEVDLLRGVYGASLIVISVFEPEEARSHHLEVRIQRTGGPREHASEIARSLIGRDQGGGSDHEYGQNVRKAFPLADYFVDATRDLRKEVERLVHLFFANPEESPTRDEYAMFSAHAAALRSADMSRQVGATIVDREGEIVAAGCNEVPRPGGGIYWTGDATDGRDFKRGLDSNALMGHDILHEIFVRLKDVGWLAAEPATRDLRALVEDARKRDLFGDARVGNLIEFGRVVHAEMNAILAAARKGTAVVGQSLYCTTFPCHGCARHIIGAGIAEVVYIEPYPKSLAVELYPEAITFETAKKTRKVKFRPFTGVAPRRYQEFFGFGRRKDARGFAMTWDSASAKPRARQLGNPHLLAERDLLDRLEAALKARTWI